MRTLPRWLWTTNPLTAYRRLLVDDCHQSECVGSVRTPVVIWSQANVARLIFALVVEAERLNPRLRCFLVKPTARENAACRFDPLHRCARSLIWNYIDLKARILKMVLV